MNATLEHPTIYDEALFGEPLGLPVRRRTLDTNRRFWIVGDWLPVLPTTVVRRAPDVQRIISEGPSVDGLVLASACVGPRHQPHHGPQRRGGTTSVGSAQR